MTTFPDPGVTHTPKMIQRRLGEIASQLDRVRTSKAQLEECRRAWLAQGVLVDIPYRELGKWSGVSNPRVHQIVGSKDDIIAAAEASS